MALNAPFPRLSEKECEPRFPPPPPTAAAPIVSAEDTMLLVAERSERAERAEGDCAREESLELERTTERAGEKSRERMPGDRERELTGVVGGEG